jgi:hypothetical protein
VDNKKPQALAFLQGRDLKVDGHHVFPVYICSNSVARRSGSISAASSNLRERLQSTHNQAAYDEIRSMASYGKKTPSLGSSVSGSSILSGTSLSSLSTVSSDVLKDLKLIDVGPSEKILAVSATELQSRMTRGVIINKQSEIRNFCLNPTSDPSLINEMKTLISNCSDIATHPYLVITPHLANSELPEDKESQYLIASSGKFTALGKILDALQGDKSIKIGIVAQHIKTCEFLEGLVRGKGIKCRRSDGASVRESQNLGSRGGPDVLLVLGGKAGFRAMVVKSFDYYVIIRIESILSSQWISPLIRKKIRYSDYDNIPRI